MNKRNDMTLNDLLAPKKRFLFDPRKLYEISKKGLGKPLEEAFEIITEEMARAYPGHICKKQEWIFSNAGGGMAQMTLLHASIREYVLFFGSCIGTEGHSGRYRSEIFDFMLRGEMRCEYEGAFEPEIHLPGGKPAYVGKNMVKHYCIKDDGWMFEYCRGNIVKMIPFGILDQLFSTLDIRTVMKTMRIYSKLTIKGLFTRGKDLTAVIKFLFFCGTILALLYWGVPFILKFFNL